MLSTIAASMAHNKRVKEEARMRDMATALATLRNEISDFRKLQGRYPRTLSELGNVPADPVTQSKSTWQPEFEESVSADDFSAGSKAPEKFVVNVRSGAQGQDANGRAWSDY